MPKRLNRRILGARLAALQERAIGYSGRGKYREAEACLREGLQLIEDIAVPPNRQHLALWNDLGMVYKYLGEFQNADKFYRLALRYIPRCLVGRERDFYLASIYHNLGGLDHSRRRFRRAERYARKSLQLRRKVANSDSLAVAVDSVALAAILDGLHKFAESKRLYHRALKIYRREYGESHREIALILNNLAALYQATGQRKRAEAQYGAALRMKRYELGPSHPDVAVTMNNLAMFYQSQGNKKVARLWFKKALRILGASFGSSHPTTRSVRNNFRQLVRTTH